MDSLSPFDKIEPIKDTIDVKIKWIGDSGDDKIDKANKGLKLFLFIVFALIIVWCAASLIHWINNQNETIVVQPFETVEISNGQIFRGEFNTNILCFELHKIKEIRRKGSIELDPNPIKIILAAPKNTIMSSVIRRNRRQFVVSSLPPTCHLSP